VTEEANEPAGDEPEADWLKQLRKDASDAKKLRQEVSALRRNSAMDELNIPRKGAGKLFRDTYTGDPDDLDALKAAAAEYELIPTADAPDTGQVDEALDAVERMADTTGTPASQPTVAALLDGATSVKDIERIARDAGFATSQT